MSLGETKDHNVLESIKGLIEQSFEKTGVLINLLRQEIKQPYILGDINWEKLIDQSKEIDFLVQGWDGWIKTYDRKLETFFSNEGVFNLFLIDHMSKEKSAETIRNLMATRLSKSDNDVISEINNTIQELQEILDRNNRNPATGKGQLTIVPIKEVNWYFGARFVSSNSYETDYLVLSLYSHKKFSLKETPAILLNKQSAPKAFEWFDSELKYLKSLNNNSLSNEEA
ncbi:MAG: hypothetical protein WBB02_03875 [Saprospiraceae bacterium]